MIIHSLQGVPGVDGYDGPPGKDGIPGEGVGERGLPGAVGDTVRQTLLDTFQIYSYMSHDQYFISG